MRLAKIAEQRHINVMCGNVGENPYVLNTMANTLPPLSHKPNALYMQLDPPVGHRTSGKVDNRIWCGKFVTRFFGRGFIRHSSDGSHPLYEMGNVVGDLPRETEWRDALMYSEPLPHI